METQCAMETRSKDATHDSVANGKTAGEIRNRSGVNLSVAMDCNSNYLTNFKRKDCDSFSNIRSNYKDAIKIFFGWSIGAHFKELALYLNVDEYVIKDFYNICNHYTKQYIRSYINQWNLGGPNVIVIIDIYPEGCRKFNCELYNESNSILCIAEAKDIPTKYWFEVLDDNPIVDNRNKQIVEVIRSVVKPGSTLVIDPSSTMLPGTALDQLKCLYPTVVTLEDLKKHEDEQRNLLEILQTIWNVALQICDNGTYHRDMRSYFASYLWNQRFGNDGLNVLFDLF